jgi:hypothetical protein
VLKPRSEFASHLSSGRPLLQPATSPGCHLLCLLLCLKPLLQHTASLTYNHSYPFCFLLLSESLHAPDALVSGLQIAFDLTNTSTCNLFWITPFLIPYSLLRVYTRLICLYPDYDFLFDLTDTPICSCHYYHEFFGQRGVFLMIFLKEQNRRAEGVDLDGCPADDISCLSLGYITLDFPDVRWAYRCRGSHMEELVGCLDVQSFLFSGGFCGFAVCCCALRSFTSTIFLLYLASVLNVLYYSC